jgi:ferredoxin
MSPYQKLIIYYFSGTGNSKNVASWISAIASESGVETEVQNIATIDRISVKRPPSNALILFISPIHGFNYPPVMLHFIRRFPKGNNRVILMNTRAGMLLGKMITPGLTGIAFYLSAILFLCKGYSIKGMVPVDLPSNWISVHPGLNSRTVKYLHERNFQRVSKHAERILSGKSDFIALREIIPDLAVAPIALGYYFIGRFFFAKTYYASNKCDLCGICIKNCPVQAIVPKNNRPFWTFRCESCMRCMSLCPKQAIETAHGFIVGVILIFYLILAPLFYRYAGSFLSPIRNELLEFVAETSLFLLLMGLLHRIIHYSLRFRLLEKMMTSTSLTRYKWWGRRYKALKDNEWKKPTS